MVGPKRGDGSNFAAKSCELLSSSSESLSSEIEGEVSFSKSTGDVVETGSVLGTRSGLEASPCVGVE